MTICEYFELGTSHTLTLLTDPRKTWGAVSFQLFWRASKEGHPRDVRLTLQGTPEAPFVWLNGHKGFFEGDEDGWTLVVGHSKSTERYPVTHVDGGPVSEM